MSMLTYALLDLFFSVFILTVLTTCTCLVLITYNKIDRTTPVWFKKNQFLYLAFNLAATIFNTQIPRVNSYGMIILILLSLVCMLIDAKYLIDVRKSKN